MNRLLLISLLACGSGLPDGATCTVDGECASGRCKERGHCAGKLGVTIECTEDDGACADPFAGCMYEFRCEARRKELTWDE